jgi:hypothetical protein
MKVVQVRGTADVRSVRAQYCLERLTLPHQQGLAFRIRGRVLETIRQVPDLMTD